MSIICQRFLANISYFYSLEIPNQLLTKNRGGGTLPLSMSYTLETEKGKAIFTITIQKEEVESGMKHAAEHMSQDTNIPGFRPGKAPYDVVKKRVGEMALLEHAAEELIRDAFVKAMLEEDLDTVGQPFFNAEKMAPGNDLVFTVEISLAPQIKKLADLQKVSVKAQDTAPDADSLERAKKDLALMQTKEIRAEKSDALKKGDKVIVSLTMKKDNVVLEGGEGADHGIYTNEPYYIEGFIDKILGSKEGESKAFTLPFPKDHYQKHLAGADIDFEVEIKEIYHLESPAIDDDFAKKIGLKDLKDLEEKLSENLKAENEREEIIRQEKEVLDALIKGSTFDDIPDILVNQEVNRMIAELEQSLTSRGQKMDEYLAAIKKTLAELKIDFTPTALKRIQAAIIIKAVAKQEDIHADKTEVDAAIDAAGERYKENEEAKKQIYSPQYRDYIEQQMTNKKVVDHLIAKAVK